MTTSIFYTSQNLQSTIYEMILRHPFYQCSYTLLPFIDIIFSAQIIKVVETCFIVYVLSCYCIACNLSQIIASFVS